MHKICCCIIIAIVLILVWNNREKFTVHMYPFAPYGYSRVKSIDGTPSNELTGLDTLCAVKFEALDTSNLRYKMTVTGTISKELVFTNPNPAGPTPPRSLELINAYQMTRYDLYLNYPANSLTFKVNGGKLPDFTVFLE